MDGSLAFKSESIKDLAAALSKAQAKIQKASRDKQNPFFNSTYADLGNIVDVIREPLAENELSYVQMNDDKKENGISVCTIIMHSSGQWINCGPVYLPASKKDPQGYGSAITYARRYSLAAAFGVATEDDDGNGASGKDKQQDKKPQFKPSSSAQQQPANGGQVKCTEKQLGYFKSLNASLKMTEEEIRLGYEQKGYKNLADMSGEDMRFWISKLLERKNAQNGQTTTPK